MKRRVFSVVAIVGIVGSIAYTLWGGLEQNLVYFVTPSELIAKGETAVGVPVRLGGIVAKGTIQGEAHRLTFGLSDEHRTVSVLTTKTPPQMFQEEMGVVVEGKMQADGIFAADRLMIKHGNEYRPPQEGELPQQIYQQLQQQTAAPKP